MPIIVLGLNHKTAPIHLLERLAIGEDEVVKALDHLLGYERVVEGVVLSTCNRIEVYAAVTKFHGGAQDLRNFLAEFCHVAPEDFNDRLYTYHDDAAARHLFRVAAGIDSMVIGESEILGQVRRAFQVASDAGAAQYILGAVFRRALRVGKRARTETAIGRNPVSISSAAIDLARRAFDGRSLAGKKVAIVGAGKMGRLAARALARSGVTDVTIVNRTEERGHDLAREFDARAVAMDDLDAVLVNADILISSTTSPQTVVDASVVERAMEQRAGNPLFIVDIAVPRDVDPQTGGIEGVTLSDIDDLRDVVAASVGSRVGEVAKVEEIIAAEVADLSKWERASGLAPLIKSLLERAEQIRRAEVERQLARTPDADRDALDRATKRLVAKLLHDPLNRAKELERTNHTYLSALRELFELDDASE